MYCTAVFCLCQMYSYIVSKPASSLAISAKLYSHLLSSLRRGIRPIKRCFTCYRNPPQDPAHYGGDHPCFCAKEKYLLNHISK